MERGVKPSSQHMRGNYPPNRYQWQREGERGGRSERAQSPIDSMGRERGRERERPKGEARDSSRDLTNTRERERGIERENARDIAPVTLLTHSGFPL